MVFFSAGGNACFIGAGFYSALMLCLRRPHFFQQRKMENREIYKAIKSIADELCSDGKTFLRADLAYELKKYGVAGVIAHWSSVSARKI